MRCAAFGVVRGFWPTFYIVSSSEERLFRHLCSRCHLVGCTDNTSSALRWRMAFRAADSVSRFAAKCGKGFGPPVTEVDWCWLVAQMAEAPTAEEPRSMIDVVKRANLGVMQHGIRACGKKITKVVLRWCKYHPGKDGSERWRTSCARSRIGWWTRCTRSLGFQRHSGWLASSELSSVEDPPPALKDGEAYRRRLLSPPVSRPTIEPNEPLKLEA